MTRPRKRKRRDSADDITTDNRSYTKKKKKKDDSHLVGSRVQHAVLSHYYPQVQSLRDYVIAQLPSSSRVRRRKISTVGVVSKSPNSPLSDVERSLGALLDTTLIGIPKTTTVEGSARIDGWKTFSQRGDESYVTLSNGVTGFVESQALVSERLSHVFELKNE
ncbi:hypothetical protein F5Y10DRAFT_17018 [Nemania abortiva]|nr:hypothetical protein F5Y10DRAFT_17018 [Nemania abortiva]